ncbi:MAG: hypothetical protein R3D03_05720 [Geminicoccaceae bacterium]
MRWRRTTEALVAAPCAPLHPADLADLLQLVDHEDRQFIVNALGPAFDPDTLPYLDDGVREELFDSLVRGREQAHLRAGDG